MHGSWCHQHLLATLLLLLVARSINGASMDQAQKQTESAAWLNPSEGHLATRRLQSHTPGSMAVNAASDLLTGFRNPAVTIMEVKTDLDLGNERSAWASLQQDVLLTRNVTIQGAPQEGGYIYPSINFRSLWYGLLAPQDRIPGIRLAPGVTLRFQRLLVLSYTGNSIPDIVMGGSNTSWVVIEDCLNRRYVMGPPAYTLGLFTSLPRPAWAGPGPNSGLVLPQGYCRSGPDPAMCWTCAFMISDMADNWSKFGTIPDEAVFKMQLKGVFTICEEQLPEICYTRWFRDGDGSCVKSAADAWTAREATVGGWMHPVATPQELSATIQALPAAFAAANTPLPSWIQPVPAGQRGESGGGNGEGSSSRNKTIGLAVGLSVGLVLLIAVVAAAVYVRSRKRRQQQELSGHQHRKAVSDPELADKQVDSSAHHSSPYQSSSIAHKPQVKSSSMQRQAAVSSMTNDSRQSHTSAAISDAHASSREQGSQSSSHVQGPGSGVQGPGSGVQGLHDSNGIVIGYKTTGEHHASAVLYGTAETSTLTGTETDTTFLSIPEGHVPHVAPPKASTDASVIQLTNMVTPDTPLAAPLLDDLRLGDNVILGAMLGEGAMGSVYKATYNDQPVAVKLFKSGADASFFASELSILGRTQHPNVVRLLGACVSDQQLALVEELADSSLEQLLYPQHQAANPARASSIPTFMSLVTHPLPVDLVLHIAMEVATGLAYLHPTIIHRDLKPGNILLGLRKGADGQAVQDGGTQAIQAKLSDFGLSRIFDSLVVVTESPHSGTLPYMAPECFVKARPAKITHKCDIYSLGILLWELLHDAIPWTGYSPVQMMYEVVIKKTRPAFTAPEDRCPRQLRLLIERCWNPDPDCRPPALEVVRELAVMQQQRQQHQQQLQLQQEATGTQSTQPRTSGINPS